jgi:hypothetical protein
MDHALVWGAATNGNMFTLREHGSRQPVIVQPKNNPSPRYHIGGSEWVVSFVALYNLKVSFQAN